MHKIAHLEKYLKQQLFIPINIKTSYVHFNKRKFSVKPMFIEGNVIQKIINRSDGFRHQNFQFFVRMFINDCKVINSLV